MAYILAFFTSVILYFGGSWCLANIYFSLFPVNLNDTFEYIFSVEILIAGIWATVVALFALSIAEKNGASYKQFDTFAILAPFTLSLFTYILFPISAGIGILNIATCIISTTYALGQWFNRL